MDAILDQYQQYLKTLTLIPSDGGRFEITVDGDLIFSGLDTGRFPGEEELSQLIGDKVGS